MIKLLEEIDEMLAAMECVAHGMEGRAITEMRGRIQTELSNSHKPVVMQGLPDSEIYRWLQSKNYQYSYDETQEYRMLFELDFPKIIREFVAEQSGWGCKGAAVASEGQGEANTCAGCGTQNAFNGVWIEGAERCYYCGDARA